MLLLLLNWDYFSSTNAPTHTRKIKLYRIQQLLIEFAIKFPTSIFATYCPNFPRPLPLLTGVKLIGE